MSLSDLASILAIALLAYGLIAALLIVRSRLLRWKIRRRNVQLASTQCEAQGFLQIGACSERLCAEIDIELKGASHA